MVPNAPVPENVAEAAVKVPVSVGDALKTAEPVPVSSVSDAIMSAEAHVTVSCPPVVVQTFLDAVRPENVIVPDEVTPVREPKVPVIVEFPVTVIPPEETVRTAGVVMAPVLEILVVAVAPKYAVPIFERNVVDAFAKDVRPVEVIPVSEPKVPAIVEFPVTAMPPEETVSVVTVGVVPNTNAPEPVSPVTAVARFAEDGVARNVATPEPKPETPVEMGSPVALVSVPEDGVPKAPLKVTNAPADPTFTPSAVATPVPRPETPVEIGSPVPFVRVIAEGVPRFGVVRVGEVESTMLPVPVTEFESVTPPYVSVPLEPPAVEAPIMTFPPTERSCAGVVVPMPTLPEVSIVSRILSPFVPSWNAP